MSLVTCPECSTKLRLKAELSPGKRIRCPKCSTPFAPTPKEDIIDSIDPDPEPATRVTAKKPTPSRAATPEPAEPDVWVDEEAEEAADKRPVRRSRRPRRAPRRSSHFGLILGLSIGGGFLVLAAVIGLVVFLVLRPSKAYRENEAQLKEEIKAIKELTEVLDGVTDPNSAKVAAAKLEQMYDRLVQLDGQRKALPALTDKENERLKEKYEEEVKQVATRLAGAAIQAGMNSKGEPTFLAAAKKYEQLKGQSLKVGK